MKTLFYSVQDFERNYLNKANTGHDIHMKEDRLNTASAVLANGYEAVSAFMNDDISAAVIEQLHVSGVKYITIRAENYDNIDIQAAKAHNIRIAHVPTTLPHSVAEHSMAMILALNRKLLLANKQVHEYNFSAGSLIGTDLYGKTVGIVGTGKVGCIMAQILHSFGCQLLAFDEKKNTLLETRYKIKYVSFDHLLEHSDIITLHIALNDRTHNMIDGNAIDKMKKGVMLINTSRGSLVNTREVIRGLDNGTIAFFGTDVYEQERGLFFYDYSEHPAKYDVLLNQLLNRNNVLITPHHAFATNETLQHTAQATFHNLDCWQKNIHNANEITGNTSYSNIHPDALI